MTESKMTGLILLTALPFTKGHEALIRFAYNHLKARAQSVNVNYELRVMVSVRRMEPFWAQRTPAVDAFCQSLDPDHVLCSRHLNDLIPQTPKDSPTFWEEWKTDIHISTNRDSFDFVYASELYGMPLARELNARYIPFDMTRATHGVSGTMCREDTLHNWDKLSDFMKPALQTRVTLFGQESVGKSTTTKHLSTKNISPSIHSQGISSNNICFVPEWAREYLLVTGIEVTRPKMVEIAYGQYAAMMSARQSNKALIFQDTDLLTTIGYWRLYLGEPAPDFLLNLFNATKSDYYIMLGDAVPLVPDPLRYGGGERETDMDYWTDLLREFDCEYGFVNERDYANRTAHARLVTEQFLQKKFKPLKDWVR